MTVLFGVLFAINSSLHSYLIISYARGDGVSLDVGFYYMSNAAGRLLWHNPLWLGFIRFMAWRPACGFVRGLVAMAALLSLMLPHRREAPA